MFGAGFFGGGFLSSFFTSDEDVIAQSAAFLRGFSPECVLTCVLFSVIGYFNGRGNSLPVMAQGVTSALLVRIPLCFFMASLPNASLHSHRPRHAYYHRLRNRLLRSVLRVAEARAARRVLRYVAEQEKSRGSSLGIFYMFWIFPQSCGLFQLFGYQSCRLGGVGASARFAHY